MAGSPVMPSPAIGSAAAGSAAGKRLGVIAMPISPAPPHSRAHSDQSVAAITPSETSVSMVEAP